MARSPNRPQCEALNKRHVVCGNQEYYPGSRVCIYHSSVSFTVAHRALRKAVLTNVGKQISQVVEGQLIYTDNPFDSLNRILMDSRDFLEIITTKLNMMGENREAWRYEDKSGAEQLRSEVVLYERALDRVIRAANALARLNMEERFQKLSEQQAASMMYIISEVFKRIGMDELQREKARQLVPEIIQEMMTTTGKKRYI